MTKFAIALAAAALLAAPSFSSSAEAGGIRVGFGFPLGSFVAHPHQNYYAAPSHSASKRAAKTEEASARRTRKPKAQVEIAEKAPAKHNRAPIMVKTAKADTKPVESDATPTIHVPEAAAVTTTPAVAATTEDVKAVETAAVETQAAAVAPAQTANANEVAKIEEPKIEEPKTEKIETIAKVEPNVRSSSKAKRVCRRFSAAVAGLIDIPCE